MMTTTFPSANPRVATLPTYEPGRPIETVARELGFGDISEIVKLASNENALGPSPKAKEAMSACISQMHVYPDGGTHALRAAIAEKLALDPANVLPGNGSNELLELLGHVYLGPDVNIVMAEQAFIVYRLIAVACGADVVAVPMRDFTHDLDAIRAAVTDKTRIVFITNPNNPTSTMVDQAAIDTFMNVVPDHVLVCFDEAYIELIDHARQPDTLKYVRDGRSVIVLRTFSKSYGLAGLRVGYALAPPPIIQLLNRVRQPFNVNSMAQRAATAALSDDAHITASRQLVKKGLAELVNGFDALDLMHVPASANFVLVNVKQGRSVFKALMSLGVIVRPMDAYGLPEFVRVTVGTTVENARLLEALAQVLAAQQVEREAP